MNADGTACESKLPSQWRSSIAVSIYEPDKEGQDIEGLIPANPFVPSGSTQRVVYYKITVTITPYVPDTTLASSDASQFLTDPKFTDYPQTYPCYGALLQVAVRPESSTGLAKIDWPYITDCEPKKRELYESVTETGEVMTGSSESLSTTKSGGSAFGLGAVLGSIIPIPGGEIVGELGAKLMTGGSFNSSSSSEETTEKSAERRETQSHSTQLSQMYHLFQAFHVGTNRGMFLMEPRPHVVSTPATFLKKPRQLEGIQEIFIAVAKKWDVEDKPLCLEVHLDTAHLYDISQQDDLKLAGVPENWLREEKLIPLKREYVAANHYNWKSRFYLAPKGYKIHSFKAVTSRGDGQVNVKKHNNIQYEIGWTSTQPFWEGVEDALDVTITVLLYPDTLTEEEVQWTGPKLVDTGSARYRLV